MRLPSQTELPDGDVTFLFTDVEGSTPLWERDPEAMRIALARHDAVMRMTIGAAHGAIVKSTGDGFLAVFTDPIAALHAGIAAQRALQAAARAHAPDAADAIALKVRMAVHSGAAELRDGDYFGTTLNRAARIMGVAHGEQILVSAATAALVATHGSRDLTLRELGEHRLKGIAQPERLLQVLAPELRAEFPPLASQMTNLRAERDVFVGRRDGLDELAQRLRSGARLVSVLGIGGLGKTRLVTRFAWSALGEYAGGTWFCDLAQARSIEGIAHAVAQALDVPLGREDAITQLGHSIAGRGKCLVILDNFEQVARFAERTIGRWLDRARDAQFLVTTREVLGIPGEQVVNLAPLAAADATELFLTRARAANPRFEPGPDDRAAIAPLLELLEGLPLAIELAAARVRVMPARTLLQRMSERFRLLASTGDRLDRQATLRAVFDWSWDLLSAPEKLTLAQLSVFEGGFTLQAAEAVVDLTAHPDAPWIVDVLQSLVQKSLVRQIQQERFDLLVSMQEYAAEHLRTPGRYDGSGPEALRAGVERHGAYFAALPRAAAIADRGAELDNLVTACRGAIARGAADIAVDTLEGAWSALTFRGPYNAALELAAQVGGIPHLAPGAVARVDHIAGRVLSSLGRNAEAYARLEASVTRARDVGDRRCECRALLNLIFIDTNRGRFDHARTQAEAALRVARELQDAELEAGANNAFGILELHEGRLEDAVRHYEAALALAQRVGNRQLEGSIVGNLGTSYEQMGSMDACRSNHEQALALARSTGDRRLEGNTLCNLGLMHHLQGRSTEAAECLELALAVGREIGSAHLECVTRCNLGIVYHSLGRFEHARLQLEAAVAVARELRDHRREGQFLSYLGLLHAHCKRADDAQGCLDRSEALLREAGDRASLGILLCHRAEAEHLAGRSASAAAALEEAQQIADDIGALRDSELRLALERAGDQLRRPTG